jgi:CTP:phosphocholine cytidylyltransferase-like protein
MRAIILAAGMGTRLRPLTETRPKALVEIAGESFFSRQLRQLRGVGIEDISVVTGYRSEAFDAWRGDTGLEFVYNEHYQDRNNLWSMYLVRERLADCLVLEGDVRLADGLLPSAAPARSCVFAGMRAGALKEWMLDVDANGRIVGIRVDGGDGLVHAGVSYWTGAEGKLIGDLIGEAAGAPGSEQMYWDEVYKAALLRIDLRARVIGPEDWAEIDNLEEKAALEKRLAGIPA